MGIKGSFTLTVVGREETTDEVLVKYLDVEQQIMVWFYHNKLTKESIIRFEANGAGVQFTIGENLNGESNSTGS